MAAGQSAEVDYLERRLNHFDAAVRRETLAQLLERAHAAIIALPLQNRMVNLHSHTFFSFNGYGYSPTYVAWKARRLGLGAVGLVDFDVLDGVDEFLGACQLLGLRASAGIETRIFVPEFASREINSPGEPGIAYHMCMGFTSSRIAEPGILPSLKATAQARNRGVAERVNAYLYPVTVDYEHEVMSLTPSGNATERHLCIAYDIKARELMPRDDIRARFWSDKLGSDPETVKQMWHDAPVFQAFLRSKLMKSGGPGYVKAEGAEFPEVEAFNNFGIAAGAIPTYAWLDGATAGERAIDELLDLMMSKGVAALNIIPDRNWNIKDADTKRKKVLELHRIVAKAQSRELPILVGTEMNAHGQRFVDDFSAPEMAPLVEAAWEGALILHAHTVLQTINGHGLLSDWSKNNFAAARDRNAFYRRAGELLDTSHIERLTSVEAEAKPEQILATLSR